MKKTLLALCAGVLAFGASAQTFEMGDAFCYAINPTFSFELTEEAGDDYVQYPALGMQGQASLAEGWGLASAWFNGKRFANAAEANEYCPIVADPWDKDSYVLRMQTANWDGFGNFNFAIPQVGELCRVRVIYRVDPTGVDNAWYSDGAQKPFHVKLMDDGDQDTYDYPELTELNEEFWNNQGWRVADIYNTLNGDTYYLSLLWDAAGLSCQRNVPFYVKEVSVVPVKNLEGDTHVEGDQSITVVQECPELVYVKGINDASISEISAAEKVAEGIYDLQGRKVAKAAHGLYIINGVKTLVK